MHEAVCVRVVEGLGDRLDDLEQRRRRQRSSRCEHVGEGLPVDEPHREVHDAVVLAGLVDGDDRRVVERCRCSSFALEPASRAGAAGDNRVEDLHRDVTAEPQLASAPHRANAPSPSCSRSSKPPRRRPSNQPGDPATARRPRAATVPAGQAASVTDRFPAPLLRPPRHPRLLARPRVATWDERPVLALIGPAGSGKTAAALQAAEASGGRLAWCRLAPGHDGPRDLVGLAVTSVGRAADAAGDDPVALADELLELLEQEATVLVVDDYHHATPACDVVLGEVVPLAPAGARVVVCSRARPTGLLGRLPAGSARVVDADELAFTEDEAVSLLQPAGVDADVASTWRAATNGVAAAVAMVADAQASGLAGATDPLSALPTVVERLVIGALDERDRRLLAALAALPYLSEALAELLAVGDASGLARLAQTSSLVVEEGGVWRLHDVARAPAAVAPRPRRGRRPASAAPAPRWPGATRPQPSSCSSTRAGRRTPPRSWRRRSRPWGRTPRSGGCTGCRQTCAAASRRSWPRDVPPSTSTSPSPTPSAGSRQRRPTTSAARRGSRSGRRWPPAATSTAPPPRWSSSSPTTHPAGGDRSRHTVGSVPSAGGAVTSSGRRSRSRAPATARSRTGFAAHVALAAGDDAAAGAHGRAAVAASTRGPGRDLTSAPGESVLALVDLAGGDGPGAEAHAATALAEGRGAGGFDLVCGAVAAAWCRLAADPGRRRR